MSAPVDPALWAEWNRLIADRDTAVQTLILKSGGHLNLPDSVPYDVTCDRVEAFVRDLIKLAKPSRQYHAEPAPDDADGWRVEAEVAWSEYADLARALGFPSGGPHGEVLAAAHRLAGARPGPVMIYPMSGENRDET